MYELQRALGQERAAADALGAERDSAAGRAGESEWLVQGLVGAQAEGLKAQGALEAEVGGGWWCVLGAARGVYGCAAEAGAEEARELARVQQLLGLAQCVCAGSVGSLDALAVWGPVVGCF